MVTLMFINNNETFLNCHPKNVKQNSKYWLKNDCKKFSILYLKSMSKRMYVVNDFNILKNALLTKVNYKFHFLVKVLLEILLFSICKKLGCFLNICVI